MASSTSESLITARWIVPVVPAGLVLENHALLIKGSTIQDLLPVDSARKLYPNATRVDLPQHLLTAGFPALLMPIPMLPCHCYVDMQMIEN